LKSLVRFHDDGDVEVASKDFFLDVLELGGANTQGRQALRYRDFPGPVTIARTTGTALETIAATGDPVPAPFTGTWTTLGRSCIDDAGAVYFGGTFGDGMTETKGLFRRASPTSPLELLVVSGHPVPGAGVVVLFPEFFECDASETGALLFVAWTDLPEPQSRGVFWRSAGGSTLAAVVLETDTRPDGVSIGFLDRVEINDTLFLIGGWTTFTFGSYFALAGEFSGGTPCCLRSIAPWNQPTPVGLAYHDGVVATISPSGDIAFTAQVGPPVFQGGPSHVRMLFRESGGLVEPIFPSQPLVSTQVVPTPWSRMAFGASGDLFVSGDVLPTPDPFTTDPVPGIDLLARVVMSPMGGQLAVPLLPAGLAAVLAGARRCA